jgi:hypothetical protein
MDTNDKAIEALQNLSDMLSTKYSGYLSFTFKGSKHLYRFPTPIKLNPKRNYEMGLQYITTSNYLVNITEKNNKFIYSADGGVKWNTITIEKGAYEMTSLESEIKRQLALNKHYNANSTPPSYYINIGIKLETFHSFIDITDDKYQVDFTKPHTIRELLGFKAKVLKKGYNVSDDTVDITKTIIVTVHSDLIMNSYHNGVESNILYSFPAYLVPVGYKINAIPPAMIYLPLNRTTISSMYFELRDGTEILDNINETVALAIHIKQV